MRFSQFCFVFTLLCLFCYVSSIAAPVIDGRFADWAAPLAGDPAGDSAGPLDVRSLSAASAGSILFVRIEIASARNLSSGPSSDTSLVLSIANLAAGKALAIDFRNRTARVNGALVSWPSIDFACLPTFASTSFELRADLASINAGPGTQVRLQFSGADALSTPAFFTLSEPPQLPEHLPTDRSACALIRVASLNTFFSGIIDPARQPAITRLLRAVQADVYVFQEEYDSTLAEVQAYFNAINLKNDNIPWNVVRRNELIIASQWPLIPVPLNNSHYGAVVRVPGGPDVLVVTLHPKCCGYIGSAEDVQRISQASEAITLFNQFRAGTLSAELAPYQGAPAILAGDWNLVGSHSPLALWQGTPALTRAQPRHISSSNFWTWSSTNGLDFWPGELDLVLFDRPSIFSKRVFSLNTATLSAGELSALGLQASDSSASDHLLLVADFSRFAAADFNSDSLVEDADFSLFAPAYSLLDCADPAMPTDCPADLNFDGAVDDLDFTLFVRSYNELICP